MEMEIGTEIGMKVGNVHEELAKGRSCMRISGGEKLGEDGRRREAGSRCSRPYLSYGKTYERGRRRGRSCGASRLLQCHLTLAPSRCRYDLDVIKGRWIRRSSNIWIVIPNKLSEKFSSPSIRILTPGLQEIVIESKVTLLDVMV